MSRVVFRTLALSGVLMAALGAGVAVAQAPAAQTPATPAPAAEAPAAAPAAGANGQALFEARCKFCHDPAAFGAPGKDVLVTYEHAKVVEALTTGKMVDNAHGLTPAEIGAIASYVTGKTPAGAATPSAPAAATAPQ